MGVILTFCASAGNAASKRANAAQMILMSFLRKRFVLVWTVVIRQGSAYPGRLID
jgi:hypothetical protein